MTLGGLALAVGILVDDATVTIENIDRHLAEGKPTLAAIRDGAAQIAVPALVSTLCICIVFVPVFFLSGVAKYLFSPLAEAVIFAMIASYILSRTLVPTLAMYWIRKHNKASEQGAPRRGFRFFGWFSRFHFWFENRFEKFREAYWDLLSLGLRNAGKLIAIVLCFTLSTMALFPFLGQDFFPSVDAGAFDMHVRLRQ
jgi:multidrug efflux pump subunit AcrB